MTASLDPEAQGHSYNESNRDGRCPVCGREVVEIQDRSVDYIGAEDVPFREYWHLTMDWDGEHEHIQELCKEYADGRQHTVRVYADERGEVVIGSLPSCNAVRRP